MSINTSGTLLITSGEDKTIFVFMINTDSQDYTTLVPIGLVSTADVVTYITWHKDRVSKRSVFIQDIYHGHRMYYLNFEYRPCIMLSFVGLV